MKIQLLKVLAAACVLANAAPLSAQTMEDLKRDAATTGDVMTYGMGWGQQRHSTLQQLTPATALAWNAMRGDSSVVRLKVRPSGSRPRTLIRAQQLVD